MRPLLCGHDNVTNVKRAEVVEAEEFTVSTRGGRRSLAYRRIFAISLYVPEWVQCTIKHSSGLGYHIGRGGADVAMPERKDLLPAVISTLVGLSLSHLPRPMSARETGPTERSVESYC